MKIVIFEPDWRSPASLLIAWVTRSPFSHAAVECRGHWYDASESRGNFEEMKIGTMKGRLAYVWNMGERYAVEDFIAAMKGTTYDYKGVLLWWWRKQDNRRLYCFEAALQAAKLAKGTKGTMQEEVALGRVSGLDVLGFLGTPHEVRRF